MLDDGTSDTDGVALLERIGTDVIGRRLTGHHHHGDGVGVSSRDTGNRIRQAGAGSHEGDAHFTSGTRKTVGGVHGSLLMAHQHMLNAVLLVKRVVDIENSPTWIAPQMLDTFGLQRLDEDFGAHQFLGALGGGCGGCGGQLGFGDFHDQPL